MIDQVTKYALDVLSGNYLTGNLVKLACQRHLDDIEKSKDDDYPYYFNIKESERVISFFETLKIAEFGGEPVKLAGFQKFCMGSLMGWRKKSDDGWRFRISNIQLAKQNGKSFLNGGLVTYVSNFTYSPYAQIYLAAKNTKQARIVYNEILKFLAMDDDLAELFKVTDYKSEITALNTQTVIRALTGEKKQDGLRGTLNIVDEYHLHEDSSIYDMLKNGTGRLKKSITSVISTAGNNLTYPYYDMYLYSLKVLNKEVIDDEMFIYIAQLDTDDDIWDYRNYVKANPLYSDKDLELIYREGLRAKATSQIELVDWMTKKLNMWVQGVGEEFLDSEDIEKTKTKKTIEDFRGKECVIGIDLSNMSDLTSVTFLFKSWDEDDQEHYFIHSHSFIPQNTFKKFRKLDERWNDYVEDLTITTACQGLRLDYKAVMNYIKNTIKSLSLKVIIVAYDANNAGGILADLEEMKLDSVPIVQSMKNLTEPTLNFKLLAKAGCIEIEESLLYDFCLRNAVIIQDFGENKCAKIDKRQKNRKIDPIDATIDALKVALPLKKPRKRRSYSKVYEKLKLNN